MRNPFLNKTDFHNLLGDTEGPRLSSGIVVFSRPDRNWCWLRPSDDPNNSKSLLLGVPISGNASSRRFGVLCSQTYAPGEAVFYLVVQSSGLYYTGELALILGPTNLNIYSPLTTVFPWTMVGIDPQAPVPPSFRESSSNLIYKDIDVPNTSTGQFLDSMPGSKQITNRFGGGLFIDLFESSFGCSLLSKIIFNNLRESLLLQACEYSVDTPVFNSDCVITNVNQLSSYISRLATTTGEGLGIIGDLPITKEEEVEETFNEEWERVGREPSSEEQEGFFRIKSFSGGLFNGVLQVIYAPEELDKEWTSKEDPITVAKDYGTLDGRRIIQVRDTLTLSRSPWIHAPKELSKEEVEEIEEDIKEDFKETLELSLDEISDYWGLLSRMRNKKNIEDRDFYHLKEAKDKDGEDIFEIVEPEEDIDPGDISDEDVGYKDIGEVDEIPDPLGSDKEAKLAALLSMIELGPDGGIIIQDGWGSEIRMSRGNITVSPANDLHFRPGRDCLKITPGNDITIAGKDIEQWSEEGSFRVKTEEDLSLTAGNSGEGELLIENRATAGDDSCLVIRSRGEASFVSRKDMRIGITGPEGTEVGPDDGRSGTVWIDSGKGAMHVSGANVVVAGTSAVSMAVATSGGSCLSLSTSAIGAVSNAFNIASTGVTMSGDIEGSVNGYEITDSGIDEVPLAAPSGNCNLRVGGSSQILEALLVGQTLQARTMVGEAITTARASFGNASLTSGLRGGSGSGPNIDPPTIPGKSLEGALSAVKMALETFSDNERAFGDAYINTLAPSFTDAVGYSSKGRYIIEAPWQLSDKTSGTPLEHHPLKKDWEGEGEDVHPWPGPEGWTDDDFIKSIDEEGKPKEVGSLGENYKRGKGI